MLTLLITKSLAKVLATVLLSCMCILPNEQVVFEVKFINSVRDVYKFEGICFKDNIKVSEAEFSAMITYK